MYPPGLRLRQTRESLGLTYRDVEQSSYEIAAKRGRPEFVLHLSRLADMENRNVVPSLHKLYSLATIYHLNPMEISGWYEAPFPQTFEDGASFPAPLTHLSAPTSHAALVDDSGRLEDRNATGLWNELPESAAAFPGMRQNTDRRYRYGYIGLSDRRMAPILRPGSIVLVDMALRRIEDTDWFSEYDRPLYFVHTRGGYRCGWFQKMKSRLIMHPHTLSRCAPEAWRTPEEAEIIGKVVGVITYFNEPWNSVRDLPRIAPEDWQERVP
jgi:transcriptional regulator with XRE-family HTH domain